MGDDNKMTYQEIVDEMLAHQRHMFHYLTELKDRGKCPKSLLFGMAAAQHWRDVMNGDAGLEVAPSLEGAQQFNRALQENKDVLSEREVRLADEYGALLGDLKKVWRDPLSD